MFAEFARTILLEYSQRDFNDDASRFVHKRKSATGWGALGGAAVGETAAHLALKNPGKNAAAGAAMITGGALAGSYLARKHTINKWNRYRSTLPRKFRDINM